MAYYLHEGALGRCPDCGEQTFVRRANLLGSANQDQWEVPADLLRLFCQGLVKSYKRPKKRLSDADKAKGLPLYGNKLAFTCARCRSKAQKHYWAEIVDGGVVGPFDKRCLLYVLSQLADERGFRENIPIYITPANKKVLTEARAVLMNTKPEHDPMPTDDEVVLF